MNKAIVERIRIQMKKYPHLELWDKDFNRWTKEDNKEFERIEAGGKPIVKIDKTKSYGRNSIKVIRVSDGKIYTSILRCTLENGFSNTVMYQLLDENKKYQRICEN